MILRVPMYLLVLIWYNLLSSINIFLVIIVVISTNIIYDFESTNVLVTLIY